MVDAAKARAFAALHVSGDPVILYNAWDVGSARAVARAGARAIATGSWSVAAAQGFDDGEALPLEQALAAATRIAGAVDLPVTIDFEGGYAVDPAAAAENLARLASTGAIGCNFEDQVIGGEGLHPIDVQTRRIAAVRAAVGPDFFLNARIDLFLNTPPAQQDASLLDAVIDRARAYGEAGASGIFVPGAFGPEHVAALHAAGSKPINVIPTNADIAELAAAGVARISYGPRPYRAAMKAVEDAAQRAFAWR